MAKQLFKGFKQVSGVTSTTALENGYIYLVRDDETKEHGYIYFNGKKYGTTKDVANDIAALQSGLSAEEAARELAISGLQEELATQVSALTNEDVIDVKYDSSSQTIYIEFKDHSTSAGFDASAFIVDGMLSNVTYDSTAHTMTFIWNTDAEHTDLTIDLDDVIAPYNADEATIHKGDNNTFSAIMDTAGGVASHAALQGVQSRITTEITGVQGQITAETQARETAITGVQTQLSGVQSDLEGKISGVQGQINALDATLSASSNGVQVEITQTDGKLTNLTVTAPEAAQHTSQDKSINITTGAQGIDFGLNRETATDTTVAAGHLEIALNANGGTYAVMYYDGNDSEPAN